MTSLQERLDEFQARQEALDAERNAIKADAIAECRRIIEMFGLTAFDLKLAVPTQEQTRIRRPAKYRDPLSGKTWSGQGREPKWFAAALERGETRESLEIKATK